MPSHAVLLTFCQSQKMLLRGTGHIERIVAEGAAAVAEKAHFEMRLEDGQLNQLLDEWLCNFVCASARLLASPVVLASVQTHGKSCGFGAEVRGALATGSFWSVPWSRESSHRHGWALGRFRSEQSRAFGDSRALNTATDLGHLAAN